MHADQWLRFKRYVTDLSVHLEHLLLIFEQHYIRMVGCIMGYVILRVGANVLLCGILFFLKQVCHL